MIDDQEAEDAAPDDAAHFDRTALTNAVTAGVQSAMTVGGSPLTDLVTAQVQRAAADALGDVGGVFGGHVGGVADQLREAAMGGIGQRWSDMVGLHGVDHLPGMRSVMDAALAGTQRWDFGGHVGGVADQLREAAMGGIGQRWSDMVGLHGVDHLPGMRSVMDAALAGTQRWDFGGHVGGVADQLREAAMGGIGQQWSDMVGLHGVDHLPGMRSVMDAALAGTQRWDFGGHVGGVADQLREAAMGGIGQQWSDMVGLGGLASVVGERAGDLVGLRGLASVVGERAGDLVGLRGLASMVGERSFVSPLEQLRGVGSPGLALGAQAAMGGIGQRWSDMVGLHGVDHLLGMRSVMDAALAGTQRWDVGGVFGGHVGGVADQLRGAAMGSYGSHLDEVMRRSQRSIHDFMYGSSRFPDPMSWMNDALRAPAESITEMMRSLWPLADRGMRAAQLALRTALNVVRMLERNDPRAREAVRRFLLDWLDFQHVSWDLVCSATLVLMNVGSWLPDGLLSLTFDPRSRLRALTLKEHRAVTRLSTDPDLSFRGKPLLSLDQPVAASDSDGAPTVLRDLAADRAAPDPAAVEEEITDPRILRVWWKFTDREREILREKSQPRVTWPAAAIACGGTAGEGDRLRRKARRLARAEESTDAPTGTIRAS
ncbi:hypothetical protein [Mycobacterium sp. ELW1]|uniref:hypothetical protein n=1 Tax=Mycobacterium sp. ELW1 TaxID=1547487 RepID=UPI0011EBE97C|nr:hypothetical protein [Mycobacterium sp. ELW1]QEN12871.1 hypothetical protein D3H54_05920 [Mycobacterium sp. ELW1]